jgi:O-acetyl-ADP-ribose deacetylase (regulator of RNase III)
MKMIELTRGNLLESDAEAIVNTVNCVGVMGKGIALQFKQAFPANYEAYAKACKKKEVKLGRMFLFPRNTLVNPKYIVNFPTKGHWRAKSKIEDIENGLDDLKRIISENGIKSIAIPPLGSGLGGLSWPMVKKRIEEAFAELPDVTVYLYEPKGAPNPDQIKVQTKKPNMTRGRALLIRLLKSYGSIGYRHSLLEVQKLMYFMQETGEPLKLRYQQHQFGPYADNLNHVLQHIDGHYIRGYGDRSRKAQIYLLPGAYEEAISFLENDEEAEFHLQKVEKLIRGFETPYGMELLSTVHWVAKADKETCSNLDQIVEKVQKWTHRKKMIMKPLHIKKAWERLASDQWLPC